MTVQDLIYASMRTANIYAPGETPTTDEMTDALFALNQMLDSWSAERLLIPNTPRTVLTLTPNDSGAYQIGPGGADFPDVARPLKIERAGIIVQQSGATPVEIPLRLLTDDEWARESVKTISSAIPTKLYCDYGYPFVTVNLWPILDADADLALYLWQPLKQFAALTDAVALPSGYSEAIQYNLAGRLAIEYGQQPNPVMIQLAVDLKDRIKQANPAEYLMRADGFQGGRSFNIYTGEIY